MVVFAELTDAAIQKACNVPADGTVEDAGVICRNVFRWTENEAVARLADWLATKPLRIALIFLAAFVLNRILRRLILKMVTELSDDEAQQVKQRLRRMTPKALQSTAFTGELRSTARAETIGLVLKSTASIVVYTIASIVALGEIGIDLAPLVAGAGIVGVALGFGAQSLVKDFLSGLFMLAEDQYGVGDVVDVGEAVGTVEVVNLRTTKIRGLDGTVWYVPNGEISRVGNMSQQWARAVLDLDVAYDTDLDRAQAVVLDVAEQLAADAEWEARILEPPEVAGVQALGADAVSIRMMVKTQPGDQWMVARELRRRMKDRFDAEGIEIPFPQRVMWVRREEGSSEDTSGSLPDPI